MNWTEYLDGYCERIEPGFWAEPVNAVTNLAFLIASMAAFVLWRRQSPADWPVLVLIVIVFATGVGSFLFHTFANRWSMLADVLPIAAFIHLYFFLAMRRCLGLGAWTALAITVAFFLATPPFGSLVSPVFGSSSGYILPALAVFVVGYIFRHRDPIGGNRVLAAGVVFAVSLAFRTVDEPLCTANPLGTHFLWHLLNGTVLFLLIRVLILQRAR